MSCYRPISISNPALVKNNVFNRNIIEVPCGHCPACKDVKRLSWFVRLYYEWQNCEKHGGFGLFETLTYNNEHLPRILCNFGSLNNRNGVPCFSVRSVQLYLKKLRKQLSKIYDKDIVSQHVKYFLSMEFGGLNHRPHYHILFFCDTDKINCYTFKKYAEELWHENGFTMCGDMNNGFICNAGGISYVTKYVSKDIYEEGYYRQLENKLLNLGFKKEEFKAIYPRILCSKNLGISALEFDDNNDLNNFFEGTIYLPDKDKIKRNYKLPLYYERKIFYDVRYRYFDSDSNNYISVSRLSEIPVGCDYSPIYVLNDLGMEMKEKRAQKTLDSVVNVYRLALSVPEYSGFINKLNEKFNTHFKSIKDFQQYIKNELPEEVFVNYSMVYRGCKVSYKDDSVCSPCGSTPYYDYMLINDMSRGVRPLSVDYANLCSNIVDYSLIPHISENYNMIRYLNFLINKELEVYKNKKEYDYVMQKSAYLATVENIV